MERTDLDRLEIEANGMASPPQFKANGEVIYVVTETVADVIADELRDAESGHNYGIGSFRIPFIRRR